uniref:Uncharacterized protein n=1 Tax=Anopheles coluzzii TaxID=1518534 RepID=A0A8W7PS44_ANOCL
LHARACVCVKGFRLPGAGFAVLGLAVLQFDDCRRFSETHSVSLSGAHKISHQFEGLQPCKSNSVTCQGAATITTDHPRGAGFDPVFSMLTDMSPSAGAQFYSTQIPAMGMNITNIATHMQKPSASIVC